MKDIFWPCEVYNQKINFTLAYGWKESIDKYDLLNSNHKNYI
jgi:hypothetical protein